jgi:phenylacetate-coenzyme A ligase PaaK-like adenylate-forming protein
MLKQKRLKRLVEYARANSRFYGEKYKALGDDYKLSDIPPTTKPEMMESFDSVLTDSNITMKRIDEFTADIDKVGHMIDGKYLIFKTSGSTGNPAVVLYDKNNIDVQSSIAAFRTFARREDYKKFMDHGKKTAGVFADYGFYLACGMSKYLQLKMPHKKTKITVDVNAPEAEIIKQLNAFRPAMLSGYPSNLALLADFKELNINPDVVITGGEIACECEERHLHINEDWVIVESVDAENNPVPFGEMSDKVLITNLSNYIQPFIRYELTDRVIVHNEKCKCGRSTLWLEIEGRTDDILEFDKGVRIAPMSLYKVLEEVRGIRRFQLVQRAPGRLEIRMISDDREAAFEKAQHDLQQFFESKGLTVEIILSEDPPQANKVSGKFKHIHKEF